MLKRRRVAAWVLLALAFAPLASFSPWARAAKPVPEWAGRVTHVTDGDSLWVQPDDAALKPVEIRLADIDAPEICQPGGTQARDALKDQVGGKAVGVRTVGRDGYGRTLARVLLDGQSVNAWLVMEGHAYSNRTRWDRGPLVKQEKVARALQRGVHAQAGAVMPREFRRVRGACTPQTVAPTTATVPATTAMTARRCDGRIHCSQMTSCDEARYFLRHCPGVKMDGDGDGTPCETQWCGR